MKENKQVSESTQYITYVCMYVYASQVSPHFNYFTSSTVTYPVHEKTEHYIEY